MDNADKSQRFQEYIEALEEERRKIQVFHRELPFCLQLVTQAIDAWRQQFSETAATTTTTTLENDSLNGQSECSVAEEVGRALESVPVIRTMMTWPSGSTEDNKSDWLRSAQLWNQTPDDQPSKENDDSPTKQRLMDGKGIWCGAVWPFRRENENDFGTMRARQPAAVSSPVVSDKAVVRRRSDGGGREEKGGGLLRKSRRCWSPELHRRFLHSLQQLGGAHVATPKLIRELMKVDGLTNDEVKSHLQKYRLHSRRPTQSSSGQ